MKNRTVKKVFSKEDTLFIKGIGAIILVIHHLFFHGVMVPISSSTDVKVICTTLAKVCVPIFAVMSGYGINCSRKKWNEGSLKFVYTHIMKLLINYWIVYIPAFMLSTWFHIEGTPYDIYGGGIKGVFYCILDFVGLRTIRYPSLCNTWWFVETIFICYLFFPIIDKGLNKFPIITLIICAIPGALANFVDFSPLLGGTDRELFYLFPFAVGVYLSKRNILDRFVECISMRKVKASIVLTVSIFAVIVSGIFALFVRIIGMTVWAIVLIFVFIVIMENFPQILKNVVVYIGKHSMNIFLIHSFVYFYFSFFANIVWHFDNAIWKFMSCLGISLLFSVCIEKVKEKIKLIQFL